jgi:hypothetical protein
VISLSTAKSRKQRGGWRLDKPRFSPYSVIAGIEWQMDYHNPAEKLPKLHRIDHLQVPSLPKLTLATDARARLGYAVCYFEERIQNLEPKGRTWRAERLLALQLTIDRPRLKIQNISRRTGV